jgi:hypothetical protein
MAKIKFEFDTETSDVHPENKSALAGANKVGLLSSINVPDNLMAAFLGGFGSNSNAKKAGLGYNPTDIQTAKRYLKQIERCNVLACVGGNVVYNAIKGATDNPNFVALFGAMPDLNPVNLGNCLGGVALASWQSNKARVDYLTAKLNCQPNEIGLYYNQNSAMSSDEVTNWDIISPKQAGVSSAKNFSGGLVGPPRTNNAAQFAVDFAPAGTFFPNRVRAVVISADPFFQENKTSLVDAINAWVTAGAGNRYVCYPLQDYKNANNLPTSTRSTLYGPDLELAYGTLGFLARSVADNGYAGFLTASNVIQDL